MCPVPITWLLHLLLTTTQKGTVFEEMKQVIQCLRTCSLGTNVVIRMPGTYQVLS